MAQKVITIYADDLTGEETAEVTTHTLSLDGVTYELDLGPDSYDKLLEAVAPFTRVGRRTRKSRKSRQQATGGEDTAAIRAWAKSEGYEISERGRVPASIREAYGKAKK
ncbi:histone-like nucleoid-structuring protein Lsr2 [Streptomyces kronopolitis]|uniref:histone-like nucleoid-structuring protein Lsr2 n=1 Tax=Streptomyces kronopolitis TaxID=1612435 RepID=UPI003D960A59